MSGRTGKVPLERALSKIGAASRAQTRAWILAGQLQVNGRVVKDPWFPVTPEEDQFLINGKLVGRSIRSLIMMYKPIGVASVRTDVKGRPTVFDFLPPELKQLHPVGRLDAASSGLLLLTNDTRLADCLTSPGNTVPRVYVVSVEGRFLDEEVAEMARGVEDEGECLRPVSLTLQKESARESHFLVTLTEGKQRELRRIFSFFGHRIRKVKRIAFGPLTLDDLLPGAFRLLTEEEDAALTELCGLRKIS